MLLGEMHNEFFKSPRASEPSDRSHIITPTKLRAFVASYPWVLWKRSHSGMVLRTPDTEPAAPGAFLGIRPWTARGSSF